MKEIYFVSPVRTPIGKLSGALSPFSAVQLGVIAAKEVIRRSGVNPDQIDLAIFGNARQAGSGPNVARQIAVGAGIPHEKPAYTVNMACASGLQAILCASNEIIAGSADIVLAGGTESMSNVPYLLRKMRGGYRLGNETIYDANYQDGFMCPLCGQLMGETAENLAEKYKISRDEQDACAVESQIRCESARKFGKFETQIVPIEIQSRKGSRLLKEDEHPRDNVTLESLSKLPPVFKKGGTVHAGNSSGITDGAAALLVVSEEKLSSLGVKPMGRMIASAACGVDPAYMGIGPVPSIRKLTEKTGIKLGEIPLIELNEAFASQVLACQRELGLDLSKVNVNGGAIALGHPIGCSGARIVVTLLHEMARAEAGLGLATLCVSGGLGVSLLVGSVSSPGSP